MKQLTTQAIVLSRTDFGEADRILTLLTPNFGKLRLMARGVRKVRSKLAGGIELFSVSDISFIQGRGDIGTLISTRLITHYGHIVVDIERTMFGYELIKILSRATEDEPEAVYFDLLHQVFALLDDTAINLELIRLWFSAQLLQLTGHAPNVARDDRHQKLLAETNYNFNFDAMAFSPAERGHFSANHLKFLRLLLGPTKLTVIASVQGSADLTSSLAPLVQTMLKSHIRI